MEEFKKVALEAVKKAEERILFYYKKQIEIEMKENLSPVTKADKEAEEVIIDTIRKKFPSHGFFGEEFGKDNEDAEFVWIIDPVDGTKCFIHGIDLFGTVLGLQHEGKIVLGVSNMPAIGELIFASTLEKTTLNGKPAQVSKNDNLKDAFVTFSSSNFKEEWYLRAVQEIDKRAYQMRGYGDTYGYHLVATGRADVMYENGPKPWDISAYQIIIKQAGGRHTNFFGEETIEGPTSLATNGILHDEMLGIFKGAHD
ncbi:MAG: inositol monophosphatase family protein [Candidatus Woykebacteria bacterium]